MPPITSLANRRYCWASHMKLNSERSMGDSVLCGQTNRADIIGSQRRQMVRLATSKFLRFIQHAICVLLIFVRRHPFKVVDAIVMSHAILMIGLMKRRRSLSDKRLKHQAATSVTCAGAAWTSAQHSNDVSISRWLKGENSQGWILLRRFSTGVDSSNSALCRSFVKRFPPWDTAPRFVHFTEYTTIRNMATS